MSELKRVLFFVEHVGNTIHLGRVCGKDASATRLKDGWVISESMVLHGSLYFDGENWTTLTLFPTFQDVMDAV